MLASDRRPWTIKDGKRPKTNRKNKNFELRLLLTSNKHITSFTIGFGSNNLSAASARAARTCVLRFNNRIAGCTADLS